MPTLSRSTWASEFQHGLDGLRREGAAIFEDGERGHDGQADIVIVEVLFDGEQAGLEDERVESGFGQQNIDAAIDERFDLLVIGFDHLIEGGAAMAGIFDVAGDGKLLIRRADGAGDEARLFRIAGGVIVGSAAGQRDGGQIDFAHVNLRDRNRPGRRWWRRRCWFR